MTFDEAFVIVLRYSHVYVCVRIRCSANRTSAICVQRAWRHACAAVLWRPPSFSFGQRICVSVPMYLSLSRCAIGFVAWKPECFCVKLANIFHSLFVHFVHRNSQVTALCCDDFYGIVQCSITAIGRRFSHAHFTLFSRTKKLKVVDITQLSIFSTQNAI